MILCLATGGGKTVLASRIIDGCSGPVLFVAHRIELLNQTAQQLLKWGVDDVGIIRANDKRANPNARVQVASIDSLRTRALPPADIVFIDEAHKAAADSYQKLFAAYPDALHLGLTATPVRTDNRGLGEHYEELIMCSKPSELVKDGFIVEPKIFSTSSLPSLDDVDFVAGDYNQGQLANVMGRSKVVGDIVEEWLQHAEGRPTVVFAVNVEHSKAICERFLGVGVKACHLDGETDPMVRADILARLQYGQIQVVCNCEVLVEGWDCPPVKCIVLARPTQSLRVYLQQVGRGLRPFEGVTPVVLDHAGNVARHGFPTADREYTLTDGVSRNVKSVGVRTCPECFAMFLSTVDKCPECDAVYPVKEGHGVEEVAGKLERIEHTPENEERNFFIKQAALARAKGFKPGFAGAKFKEKFGRWPPWAWSQELNAEFSRDTQWQENKAANEERKAWFAKPVEERAQQWAQDEGVDDEIPF